jgi:hypothetical protein
MPSARKTLIEDGAKPLVSVVDLVLDLIGSVVSGFGEVPGDLGTPHRIGRPVGHPADEDLSGLQIDEEQHVERLEPY